MSLLDSLKKATAIGLTHSEHYVRAYERGVLLGPSKYAEAASLFDEAAQRAGKAGDQALQARANANARLYGFITSGNAQQLSGLAQVLPHLQDIEQIGSATEVMPAQALLAEVVARLVETEANQFGASDHLQLSTAHDRAAGAFKAFFMAPLITYRFQSTDQHVETAQSRFFYHQGLAAWHQALAAVGATPEGAAEHMGKALAAFRQCNDARRSDEAQGWLSNCRMKRTCWVCHREIQGATVHFKSYPATVSPYVTSLVAQLGQDVSTLDARGFVVLCTTCGSVVERQAEAFAEAKAQELRLHYDAQIGALSQAISQLNARVAALRFTR
jgi:hypothetical protein